MGGPSLGKPKVESKSPGPHLGPRAGERKAVRRLQWIGNKRQGWATTWTQRLVNEGTFRVFRPASPMEGPPRLKLGTGRVEAKADHLSF